MTNAIGTAVVQSLWQSTLVAAVVWIALLGSRSAAARYWIACAGLVLMLVAPVATVWSTSAGTRQFQNAVQNRQDSSVLTVRGSGQQPDLWQQRYTRSLPWVSRLW